MSLAEPPVAAGGFDPAGTLIQDAGQIDPPGFEVEHKILELGVDPLLTGTAGAILLTHQRAYR